jgi:hypothetical protein
MNAISQIKNRLNEVNRLLADNDKVNHSDDLHRIQDEACYRGQIGALEFAIEMIEKERSSKRFAK